MKLKATCVVGQRGGEFPRPMDPAALDDHHDLFAGVAKDAHDLMEILVQFLGINMRHALREEARGASWTAPQDAEQDVVGGLCRKSPKTGKLRLPSH